MLRNLLAMHRERHSVSALCTLNPHFTSHSPQAASQLGGCGFWAPSEGCVALRAEGPNEELEWRTRFFSPVLEGLRPLRGVPLRSTNAHAWHTLRESTDAPQNDETTQAQSKLWQNKPPA